jgi:hypothetical protein
VGWRGGGAGAARLGAARACGPSLRQPFLLLRLTPLLRLLLRLPQAMRGEKRTAEAAADGEADAKRAS